MAYNPYSYVRQSTDPAAGYAISGGSIMDPNGVTPGKVIPVGPGDDYASQEQNRLNAVNSSMGRFNNIRNGIKLGTMAIGGMAAAPALAGLFAGAPAAAGAAGSLGPVGLVGTGEGMAGGGFASAAAGGLAKQATSSGVTSFLGKLFGSPAVGTAINAGASIYGTHAANNAAEQARADQLKANTEAIALQRQQLEAQTNAANLDRADAKALNDAINKLKQEELDATEEERQYQRNLTDQREARLAPYRASSDAARAKLMSMWGIG